VPPHHRERKKKAGGAKGKSIRENNLALSVIKPLIFYKQRRNSNRDWNRGAWATRKQNTSGLNEAASEERWERSLYSKSFYSFSRILKSFGRGSRFAWCRPTLKKAKLRLI